MPFYKQSIKKMTKSYATWIIVSITFLATIGIVGFLSHSYLNSYTPGSNDYASIYNGKTKTTILITGFVNISLFISIFAGFKTVQIFKSEEEDGTMLLFLSKPISRKSIFLQKILALISALSSFAIFCSIFIWLSILMFEDYSAISITPGIHPAYKDMWVMGIIEIPLFILVGTLFSGISMLFGSKLSSRITIAVSIGFGLFIPLTSTISYFTRNIEYEKINYGEKYKLNILNKSLKDNFNFYEGDSRNYFYPTGEKDKYKFAWLFDLNYHFSSISRIADAETFIQYQSSNIYPQKNLLNDKIKTKENLLENNLEAQTSELLTSFLESTFYNKNFKVEKKEYKNFYKMNMMKLYAFSHSTITDFQDLFEQYNYQMSDSDQLWQTIKNDSNFSDIINDFENQFNDPFEKDVFKEYSDFYSKLENQFIQNMKDVINLGFKIDFTTIDEVEKQYNISTEKGRDFVRTLLNTKDKRKTITDNYISTSQNNSLKNFSPIKFISIFNSKTPLYKEINSKAYSEVVSFISWTGDKNLRLVHSNNSNNQHLNKVSNNFRGFSYIMDLPEFLHSGEIKDYANKYIIFGVYLLITLIIFASGTLIVLRKDYR
ncbi:MAG: ABC transporter permease [Mollicutes bacterium PWAP]|nr:ABC transporter permease [Mollicutes bacterium PWAP]